MLLAKIAERVLMVLGRRAGIACSILVTLSAVSN